MNRQSSTAQDSRIFLLLIAAFIVSVAIGLVYRSIYGEIAVLGTMLPSGLAIAYSSYVGVTTCIFRALLLWLYFPLAFATALFGSALGCNEGMLTLENLHIPRVAFISIFLLSGTIYLTYCYLRSQYSNNRTSIMPYCIGSIALQALTVPFVLASL